MSPIPPPWPRLLRPPAISLFPANRPAAGLDPAASGLTRPAADPHEMTVVRHLNFLWLKAHLTGLEAGFEMEPEVVLSYWFHLRYLWLWAGATPLSQAPSHQPTLPAFLAAPTVDVSLEPEPLTQAARRRVIQAARHFFVWAMIARPAHFQALSFGWVDALRPAGHHGNAHRILRTVPR